MPTVINMRDAVRQQADLARRPVPEAEVSEIVTAFGSFVLVKRVPDGRPPEYLLRGGNSAGRLVLTGHGDPFAPDVEVPGRDDADARLEALCYLFRQIDSGFAEFCDLCRESGLVLEASG